MARLRQEREERLQRRNKIGVHNRMPREPMKNPLPAAARGNMVRKNSNANKLHPESKAPLRRNHSNYNQRKQPPAKQVAELENWEERRKAAVAREKEKQRAAAAKERAIMERREEERREKERQRARQQQRIEEQKLAEKREEADRAKRAKAKERVQMQLPSSNFPQHRRPSGAQQKRRPVPPALQEKLGAKKSSADEKQKKTADLKAKQMEAIAKLKKDKEILDQRMKSKMMSKGKEPDLKGPPVPSRNPSGAAADKFFVPAIPKKPTSKGVRNLPTSVSEAHIGGRPENAAAKEGGRVGRKSASSADLVKGKGSGANPVVPKKVIKADLLANRIVEAAAKGTKGVVVRKSTDSDSRLGPASLEGGDESDGGDSSDFSQSDSEEEFEVEGDEEEGGKGNDEVLEEREKELERELLVATLRCEELTETIKRCGPAGEAGEGEEEEEEEGEKGPLLMGNVDDDDEEEEEEEEEEVEDGVDEGMIEVSLESSGEDKAKENKAVSNNVDAKDTTPKRRGGKKSVGEKTMSAPTPENGRGSIRARVRFLQQRCVKVLGEQVYDRAYAFLKESQDADRSDEEVEEGLKGILGEGRVMTFGNLIDQIVFMEQC